MKVRIGIALGQWPTRDLKPAAIRALIDGWEALNVDSIWVSDRLLSSAPVLEPITFLSYIAGRLRKMKLGTSALVLPSRHPVVLAKELATLDFLSEGRFFPAIGLGSDESNDLQATGISRKERGARADEMMLLLRRLWSEESVTFKGRFFSLEDASIMPRPWQKGGPPLWVGGRSAAAHRRAGRLGDGWLVSSAAPAEVAAGIASIRIHAEAAERQIPDDHYGVLIPFYFAASSARAAAIAAPSLRQRADLPLASYTAFGSAIQVRETINRYIGAGATKFVMRPCGPVESWDEQVKLLAEEVIAPLQTPD